MTTFPANTTPSTAPGAVSPSSRTASSSSLSTWRPTPGSEWASFIARSSTSKDLTSEAQADLLQNCRCILGKCTPPHGEASSRTGLVIGCIQSGKTLSFTGVTCLARDNGFQIIIVISGTAKGLLEQTRARLAADLGFGQGGAAGWMHIPIDAGTIVDQHPEVVQRLKTWTQEGTPAHLRRTVVITVLKHAAGLRRVTQLLKETSLRLKGGLANVPVLIIDDEADQASLNTRARTGNGESATYAAIRRLRAELPRHTLLQYTATAQAPLLLSVADTLSPDFCHVLDPGPKYTGAAAFLIGSNPLYRVIPASDVPAPNLPMTSPPPTMQHALACFVLGFAQDIAEPGTLRTMVIHNSRGMNDHAVDEQMVRAMISTWTELLQGSHATHDFIDLRKIFEGAWTELHKTVADLKPLDTLLESLPLALQNITIKVLNSNQGTNTGDFPWGNSNGWILIGGQALDRGFTVKGLTVTYMGRDLPVSTAPNADTLQQRARFFGYRASYLSYCRVWMTQGVSDAMLDYFDHEQALRSSLRPFSESGRDMRTWRRAFLLDPSMAPTRRNVLSIPYQQLAQAGEATKLEEPCTEGPLLDENRAIIDRLCALPGWTEWFSGTQQSEAQRHLKLELPIGQLIDLLLEPWHSGSSHDATSLSMRMVQAGVMLERDPAATATLVRMSPRTGNRTRRVNGFGEIDNLMQGMNPGVSGAAAYPGDAQIHAPSGLTVQIHRLNLHRIDEPSKTSIPYANDVPTLAIICPDQVPMVVQNQPGVP